jgi:serine/threonine protein phosphatase PrpC
MLISKTICHQGLVRDQNEDSFLSNDAENFWLVADGVGGNAGGEIASQIAVQAIDRKLRQGSSLATAIEEANQAILCVVSQQPDLKGMATTIVAAKFIDNQFELAWVGDSRAYIVDLQGVHLLSSDHNVANELYLKGELTKQEAQAHPGQHELTQALGQLSLSDIPVKAGKLSGGSIMLLCSDGLSGVLSEELILKAFREESSLEKISNELLQLVLKAGAPDNVTISLIKYQESDPGFSSANIEHVSSKSFKTINKAPITWSVLFVVALIMVLLFYVE